MTTDKYTQLLDMQLLHRIWGSDLELALQEVNFWDELLGTLGTGLDPAMANARTWQIEIDQLHHFRRLATRLLGDLQTLDKDVADGVRRDHVLDTETRLDQQYLRVAMDSFLSDFRPFKTEIRHFLVAQPTF